jgi:urea transporter
MIITVLGCVGGAEILTALAEAVRARKFPGLLLSFTAMEFLIVLAIPNFMDR